MSRTELPPIIYGIETEYTGYIVGSDYDFDGYVGACHAGETATGTFLDLDKENSAFEVLCNDDLEAALCDAGITHLNHGYLSNGGRFYFDESGPEYCTPETRTAEEAVHRMFAGDRLVMELFARLREKGIILSAQFNRRSCDHQGNSRGTHINTPVSESLASPDNFIESESHDSLAILNVAKGAICGSGGLLIDPHTGVTDFYHSPRLAQTSHFLASGSLGRQKPLVRTYLKPDAQCMRLESVAGDALNFAWPMRASLVLTQAMSRLLSAGLDPLDPMVLASSVRAAQDVGHYGNNIRVGVQTKGKIYDLTPATLLTEIAERALECHEQYDLLDKEMVHVLKEVIQVCDKMTSSPEAVEREVESIARKKFLDSKKSDRVDYGGEELCRFDYLWDMIGGGIAEQLRENNRVGWLGFTSMHSVRKQRRDIHVPPADTRAKLRADIIRGEVDGMVTSWHCMKDEDELIYYLPPLATDFSEGILIGSSSPVIAPH